MKIWKTNLLACLVLTLLPAQHLMAQFEILVATSGEKSDIGLANDSVGFMYNFSVSPDGSWWAGEFELDNALDPFHLRGQGTQSTDVIWLEGDQAPGSLGGTISAIFSNDRQVDINNQGLVTGLARFNDQGMILGEFVYEYGGNNLSLVAATGESIPGITGVNYGDRFYSPNSDNSGTTSYVADNITGSGVTTANDAVALSNNGLTLGPRKGETIYASNPLQRLDDNRFVTNTAGDRFLFTGDTTGPTASDDVVVLGDVGTNGSVVLQENVTSLGTSQGNELFDVASHVAFGGDDWFVAGDTVGGTGVVIRNGEVLASEGDLAPDGFNYTGDPFALAADDEGNFAWAWQTTNPDAERNMIVVYNGVEVAVTEGDTLFYDANGDGMSEELRMDRLFLDFVDLAVANDQVYFMTEIDDPGTTVFAGFAFVRVAVTSIPEPGCGWIGILIALSVRRRGIRCSSS